MQAEEMPRALFTRQRAIAFGLFVASVVAFLYFVLPQISGVGRTVHRIGRGDPLWIVLAVLLEVCSFAGYVALFGAVFTRREEGRELGRGGRGGGPRPGNGEGEHQGQGQIGRQGQGQIGRQDEGQIGRQDEGQIGRQDEGQKQTARGGAERIGWRESYLITLAGLAATRLFAAAGAGGVALTAWALRRSGMGPRLVACRMVAFMALLYAIYALVVLIVGLGLGTGVFPGGGSVAITILPAIVAGALILAGGAVALLPGDIERRLGRWSVGPGRAARWVARIVSAPGLAARGVRMAFELVRAREVRLLGAPAWWGFDAAVLWACFHAFGVAPPFTVILMAYFVGMLGNLLPLPGGLGGVEGGMIGAFAAFGVEFNLAVLAVLTYRGIAFWLPTLPGGIAYLQLRRTVSRWREQESSEPPAADSSGAAPDVAAA